MLSTRPALRRWETCRASLKRLGGLIPDQRHQYRMAAIWNQRMSLVELSGIEPLTSPLSGVRSNQLSYRPVLAAPPAGFEPHSQEPGGSQKILIHYKRVSRTRLNVLGGYAAHDHRAMADRAKKVCIGAPAPAVRDGSC